MTGMEHAHSVIRNEHLGKSKIEAVEKARIVCNCRLDWYWLASVHWMNVTIATKEKMAESKTKCESEEKQILLLISSRTFWTRTKGLLIDDLDGKKWILKSTRYETTKYDLRQTILRWSCERQGWRHCWSPKMACVLIGDCRQPDRGNEGRQRIYAINY